MRTMVIALLMGIGTTAHAGSKPFAGHAEGTVVVNGSTVEIHGQDFVVAVEGSAKDALAKKAGATVTAHGPVRITDRSKLPIRGVISAKLYEETIPLADVAKMLGVVEGAQVATGSDAARRASTRPVAESSDVGTATVSAGTKR